MITVIKPRRNNLLNLRWTPPLDQPNLFPTGDEAIKTSGGGVIADLVVLVDNRPAAFGKISNLSNTVTFTVNLNAVNRVFDVTAILLKSFSHTQVTKSHTTTEVVGEVSNYPLSPSHDWNDKIDRIAGRPIYYQETVTIDTSKDPASCEVFSKSAKIQPVFEWSGYLEDGINLIDVSEVAHTWKQMKPFYWDDQFLVSVTFDEIVLVDDLHAGVIFSDNLLNRCPCFKFHGNWTGVQRQTINKCPFYAGAEVSNLGGGPASTCVAYSYIPVLLDATGINYTVGRSVDSGVFNQTGPFDVVFTLPFQTGDDPGDVNRYLLYRMYNSYPQVTIKDAEVWSSGAFTHGTGAEERSDASLVHLSSTNKALLVGGYKYTEVGEEILPSAELFDVAGATWSSAGSMSTERRGAVSVFVPASVFGSGSGKVFVIGGKNNNQHELDAVDVYDVAGNTWSTAASTKTSYYGHAAVFLPNSKRILVVGDNNVEWYDPLTNVWTTLTDLDYGVRFHEMSVISATDGDGSLHDIVLITGGSDGINSVDTVRSLDCNVYLDTWTWLEDVPYLGYPRHAHAQTQFGSYDVLVAGGFDGTTEYFTPAYSDTPYTNTVERFTFDPVTWEWTQANGAPIADLYVSLKACTLGADSILLAGGKHYQLYTPSTDTWAAATTFPSSKEYNLHSLVSTGAGKALLYGGTSNTGWNLGKIADINLPMPTPWTNVDYKDQDVRSGYSDRMRHLPRGWEGQEALPGYTDIVYFPNDRGYGDECEDLVSFVICGGEPMRGSGGSMLYPIINGTERHSTLIAASSIPETVDFFSTANSASGRYDTRYSVPVLGGYVTSNPSIDQHSRWVNVDQDLTEVLSADMVPGYYIVFKHEWTIGSNSPTTLTGLAKVGGTCTPKEPKTTSQPAKFFIEQYKSNWFPYFDSILSSVSPQPMLDRTLDLSYGLASHGVVSTNGDEFYVGMLNTTFSEIRFNFVSTAPDPTTITGLTFEYWDGANWTALSNVVDTTYNFSQSGTVTFDIPNDWAQRVVLVANAYYVRISFTGGASVIVDAISVLPGGNADTSRLYTGYGYYSKKTFVAPEASWPQYAFMPSTDPVTGVRTTYRLVMYTAYQIASFEAPSTLRLYNSTLTTTLNTMKEWYNLISVPMPYAGVGDISESLPTQTVTVQRGTVADPAMPNWSAGALVGSTAIITDKNGNSYEKLIISNLGDEFTFRVRSSDANDINRFDTGPCTYTINTCNPYMMLTSTLTPNMDIVNVYSSVHPREFIEQDMASFAFSYPTEEIVELTEVVESTAGSSAYEVHFDRGYRALGAVLVNGTDQSLYARANDQYFFNLLNGANYTYFGADVPFSSIWLEISTPGEGYLGWSYEYWNGVTWTGLADVVDETVDAALPVPIPYTRNGQITFTPQPDWALTTVGGYNLYWVRIATDLNMTVTPTANVAVIKNLYPDLYPMTLHPVGDIAINIVCRGDRRVVDPELSEYGLKQHMMYTRANRFNDPFCDKFRYF